jgi:hypothetical protein
VLLPVRLLVFTLGTDLPALGARYSFPRGVPCHPPYHAVGRVAFSRRINATSRSWTRKFARTQAGNPGVTRAHLDSLPARPWQVKTIQRATRLKAPVFEASTDRKPPNVAKPTPTRPRIKPKAVCDVGVTVLSRPDLIYEGTARHLVLDVAELG